MACLCSGLGESSCGQACSGGGRQVLTHLYGGPSLNEMTMVCPGES